MAFTVSLSHAGSDAVTVQYTTSDGTATAGTDYTAASGLTLSIAAGMTEGTFTIATTEDTEAEDDETFTVTLSGPSSERRAGEREDGDGDIEDDAETPMSST